MQYGRGRNGQHTFTAATHNFPCHRIKNSHWPVLWRRMQHKQKSNRKKKTTVFTCQCSMLPDIYSVDPKQRPVQNSYDRPEYHSFFLSSRPKQLPYCPLNQRLNSTSPATTTNRTRLPCGHVEFSVLAMFLYLDRRWHLFVCKNVLLNKRAYKSGSSSNNNNLPKISRVSLQLFSFHMKITLSSSPDANSSPDGDHRTTLTARWWRVRSAANSTLTVPAAFCFMCQI